MKPSIGVRMIAAGLTSFFAAAATAQMSGNPGGLAADTPGIDTAKPAPDHSNVQDKLFVRQAALGGQAEVDLAKMAQSKANSPGVRDFAQRMMKDHSKANDELMRLSRGVNGEIPKQPDPEHATLRAQLQQAKAAQFDADYMAAQVQDHQKTANLLLWEISYGQNQGLTKYAAQMLPVVMEHLDMAKQQLAQLSGSAPPPPPQ